ncbi:MAG: response regulator [Alphaproteobacteria bacterium]|nr:response regulator [Alphaproteobacteria bacterium]
MANILLVDDVQMVRLALSTLLQESGHTVTEASDGKAALKAAGSDAFDIVVTDVFMPAMDGIELIRHLRESYPDLKIIAISGGGARQPPEFAINLASALGADVTMQKPMDNEDLLTTIDGLMRAAA